MTYGQFPRWVRYLVALVAWAVIVAGDLIARVVLLVFLPLLWINSAFGMAHTQQTAQTGANYFDFYTRRFMRPPLLLRRRQPAYGRPKAIK